MKIVKLLLRLFIALALSPLLFPLLWLTYGLGGLVPVLSIMMSFAIPVGWVCDSEKIIKEGEDALLMFFIWLSSPFVFSYRFIVYGEVNLD